MSASASLVVWYPGPRDGGVFDDLSEAVRGMAAVVREAPETCDVLIEGRPTPDQLVHVARGGAVIVPFAGVPPQTIEALRDRPDLSLHNLHHNDAETAETALALLLACSRRIVNGDRFMRVGDWTPRYTPEECIRLDGLTAMVLGMGSIGRRVAAGCAALGMRVIGIRRGGADGEMVEIPLGATRENGVARVRSHPAARFRELLPETNVLLITVPLTNETEGLIGSADLASMAKPALLVNVARASIVNEEALYEALRTEVLHSAGLDVWYRYPKHPEGIVPGYFNMPEEARKTFPSEFPFHELNSVVMSPHRGGSSRDSEILRVAHLQRLIRQRAQTGSMENMVIRTKGY